MLSNERSIHDPITRNKFQLFKEPKKRRQPNQNLKLRNSVALFGHMYIANQHRQGNPLIFFSHENQLDPPSIADDGKLRKGDKAKLLECIVEKHVETINRPAFDCHIIDGGTLLHTLMKLSNKAASCNDVTCIMTCF